MNVSELQKLRIKELTELATKLEIESYSGMNRQELIVKILEAQMEKDGGVTARGVLEVLNEGYGFLRSLILTTYQDQMIFTLAHLK